MHTTIDAEHETLVGPTPLLHTYNRGFAPKEIFSWHYNKFMSTVPDAGPVLISGSADNSVVGFSNLMRYSALYVEYLHIYSINSMTKEELTYQDLYKGEVIETRYYTDNFIDDESLYMTEHDTEIFTIVNLNSGQRIDASNVLLNASQLGWSTRVWGIDNVPAKFDTVTTTQEDSETISNINEATILINIATQYSVFDDHLQRIEAATRNGGTTTFKVTGVFLTPQDGRVYYTSDKYSFGLSSTHDDAKTDGHYLYYDSDLNGFYETVFILTPDNDGDGVYDVISVGYNYDGSHDFLPYVMVQMTSELFGTIHFSGESSKKRYVGYVPPIDGKIQNQGHMFVGLLDEIEALYPRELSDGYGAKDQIFEIYRLVPGSFESNRRLYWDVHNKQYAASYNSYMENVLGDIAIQVVNTVTAGLVATVVAGAVTSTGWGAVVAPLVFAIVYFTLSWIEGLFADAEREALRQFRYQQRISRTFYSDYDGTERHEQAPHTLNVMRTSDVGREGIIAANEGHPGSYYSKVYGGKLGNMYEADVIASPPKSWRSTITPVDQQEILDRWDEAHYSEHEALAQQMEDEFQSSGHFNLDYFLINSELPGLADTLNSLYSTGSEFRFYNIELDMDGADRMGLYNAYKTNTLGYVEQQVKIESGGQFDTIRSHSINGIPQYTFIDSQDEISRLTQPLTPRYSPIIVSQARFDELLAQDKYSDAVMTIAVDCAYGHQHYNNDGIDPYQLDPSKVEDYKSRIPLSPSDFNYPIIDIIIDVKHPVGGIVKSVDVDSSDYTVIDGNLYFYRTLEEIIFTGEDEWRQYADALVTSIGKDGRRYYHYQTLNIDYEVHIHFATIIPYTSEVNTYLSSREVLDVSSNDLARTALAQAVSYAISDYFNQYYMGYTDGTNEATRDYTVLVTFWSTLISTLILLPVAAYTSSSTTALSFTQALAVGTIGIVPGVVSEIFEELYVDPYIEAWVSAQVYAMGGDEKAAQLWSMFVTSFREALFGGVSGLIEMMGSSSSDTSIDVNIDVNTQQQQQQSVESQLTAQKQKAENTLVDIESNKAWKSLFNIENLIGGIATAIPSLFIGGGDLGALSMALDLSTDIIQTKLQNYYMKGILNTHIAQIDRTFEILEALKPRPALDTSAINVAWLFVPRVEVVSSVASEAELMTASSQYAYPAPMMSMGPVFEFNHKQTKEAIEKLNELEGAVSEELKKVQNEYDSVELGKLDVTINSYKELMYEKHTVFVDIGPYGGVNYRVLEIIMDKSSKGETLTDLEKFILSEGAKRMGGQGAPLNPQETPIDPVLTEIYLKLEQRHEDQLIEYIKARASLLKHLEFDFGSLANSLDSSISVLPIVTSIDDFINIEFKKQFDLRFSNDLKINELVNVKLSEDGSSSIEFVFLDKLIKKSTDSFEKLYLRICKAVMEVFADPQRSSQASYIKRIFGSADNLIITTLERPYQVTKVSLIMGMGRAYLTDTLQRSDRPLDARAMIYFKTIAQKIQPALDKAFGRDVSMGIISEYLGEQGRRFQLLYSLYSLVTEKTGQYYTQGAFSKILFGKEDKVSILLRTPNPMIGDINSMWTLEYLATQAKPRPRLGFNPNKETLKSIIDETKKIIHKTITNQISGSLSPLAVKMIFDSLYALSEKGGFYNLGRLSKLIDRHESKLYLVGKVLGAGRNPADSVVSTLLELLVTEEVSAEHEAFKSANLFLQTRGLEYLDFDFYVKKFIELSGPRVSDSSILSPEEVLMAKTIVWGISGGRSWVTGEQINYDETVLHHILHDPKSHLTLYGLDHENKFSYFAAVTAGENTGELEGKNKKVHENELLYMWEQIRAGNYYEATRHWKNKQWRRDFARQATSLNYIDNWVKRLS